MFSSNWTKMIVASGLVSCLAFANTTATVSKSKAKRIATKPVVTATVAKVAKSAKAAAPTTAGATTSNSSTSTPSSNHAAASVESVKTNSYFEQSSRFYGMFELRPSYTSLQGEVHSEDTIEAGYQLNKNMKVGYTQYFTTNLYSNTQSRKGLELLADDAFFRFKGTDLWTSADGANAFSYQFRVYAPTLKSKRDVGYVTSIRNQFKIAHKFSNLLSVDFNVIPIFHGYNKGGSALSGSPTANPVYEQMSVLNADVHFTDKLTFSLPIIYSLTRYRSYEGATLSSRWGNNLWAWPELDYDINSMNTVGLAYYTDNFVSPTGGDFHPGDALTKGVFQLLWTLNL